MLRPARLAEARGRRAAHKERLYMVPRIRFEPGARFAQEVEMAIESVGVIGAGQMGGGIAQVCARSGVKVLLADANKELAERGKGGIAKQLDKLVERGKLEQSARDDALGKIEVVENTKSLASADMVIEAATENEELKLKIFSEVDGILKPNAIIASNTSSISITRLGAATKRPHKVIGMHFMNPVPLMKLVEVIRSLATDEDTYRETVSLAERLGKTVVTSRDIPGFIVNRLLIPFLNEACYALYEGLASREDIDRGIKLGLNHPMGPFELADLIGLDTCLAIAEVLHRELGEDKYRPCPLLRQYVAAGWLGRKSGRGFYDYTAEKK